MVRTDVSPDQADVPRRKAFSRRDFAVLTGLAGVGWLGSRILRENAPLARDMSSNGRALTTAAQRTSRAAGNPEGSVTIVAFNDFLCPICKVTAHVLAAAVKHDGDVRIEYRDLAFFGPMAERAALVGLAMDRQGLYSAYHDRTMAMHKPLSEAVLRDIANDVGADREQAADDLKHERKAFMSRLQQDANLAFGLGIRGTPAFLVENLLAIGRLTESEFLSIFAKAREMARDL
ncbi:DsbA family protein [Sphingobium sp. UBA5915]|uniref:DsbA family protein n=1 Tax=Sphingobium sp. UBA5915 TaxID=1947530 RepID=UPI0025DAF9F3|nr:DsbA family protein [Sphingobium sp. UBA5915]